MFIDDEGRITGGTIQDSHDTPEHVAAVEADAFFWNQFIGHRIGKPFDARVDGVSGATLTSMSLAGGIVQTLGELAGQSNRFLSLAFPDPIEVSEVLSHFPTATQVTGDPIARVTDTDQQTIGYAIRTGPLASATGASATGASATGASEGIPGYQGPTETLLVLAPGGQTIASRMRQTFDNEPYTQYIRDDDYFWDQIRSLPLGRIEETDVQRIEGVSGATMTSIAITESVAAMSRSVLSGTTAADAWTSMQPRPIATPRRTLRISSPDFALLLILLAVVGGSFLKRRSRLPRPVWLILVTVVLGFWGGNLVSLSLLSGWSTEGVTWTLAIGLVVLVGYTIACPPMTKINGYCSHLCPHGALQQLVRPGTKSRRKRTLPSWAGRTLAWLPGVTLVVAYLLLLVRPTTDLTVVEPFYGYLWRFAPMSAVLFAAGTLIVSGFVPMAYCRFGCPTGRLLEHLRRTATSDRWEIPDWVAVGLLVIAVTVRFTRSGF